MRPADDKEEPKEKVKAKTSAQADEPQEKEAKEPEGEKTLDADEKELKSNQEIEEPVSSKEPRAEFHEEEEQEPKQESQPEVESQQASQNSPKFSKSISDYGREFEEQNGLIDEDSSEAKNAPEQSLDDLANQSEIMPTGVDPSRPKSFNFDMNSEEDNNQYSSMPRVNQQIPSSGVYSNRPPKSGGGFFKMLILLVIALLVIVGTVYLLKGHIPSRLKFWASGPAPVEQPKPSPTPSPAPTPSPLPSIERSKFKIRVLNGTPKSGLAASVSGKLKGLGYLSDKVGNATNSSFTRTQISAKSVALNLAETLIKDLSPDYDATISGILKDSDTADGEVIIGAK